MIAERLGNVALVKGGDHLSLVVALAEEPDTPIGTAMFKWVSEEHAQAEVGYTLHPDHQGKGYATELSRALVDLGFRETELHRIIGRLDARNIASRRVLEKAGMRVEAHLVENELVKGEWTDELICALLRTGMGAGSAFWIESSKRRVFWLGWHGDARQRPADPQGPGDPGSHRRGGGGADVHQGRGAAPAPTTCRPRRA